MSVSQSEYKVELKDISKSFGGITALERVTFKVKRGEVHVLMGENGAGKSTLMKILSGAYRKDTGSIWIDGKEVEIRNTHDSNKLGIGIIYQEFSLVPELSVAENIFLNQLGSYGFWMDWKKMKKEAAELIESIGFHIQPSTKVKHLSIAQQQIVEIAKALALKVDILILDEPSAVLGSHEIETLFKTLRRLKENGVAIIYISHRLEEVFEIGDRMTVLKNGTSTDSLKVEDTNKEEIIQLMLGRALERMFPDHESNIGEELLKIDGLSLENKVEEVSLSVRSGEIVGIAGLVGSGRTETLQAVFGSKKRKKGTIKLSQKEIRPRTPWEAVKLGIGMVPEDRKSAGLITNLSLKENISLTNLKKISNQLGFIYKKKERDSVDAFMKTLRIKAENEEVKAKKLSGGNQQKVVIAKWLTRECNVVLIDEPTRGVDVGAKIEIYNQINNMSDRGLGLLVVSSETTELLNICDRILVMHEGRVKGELLKDQFSEENVLRLAMAETVSSEKND